MIEEQQTILSIKNYVSNIRSRIFNDNKVGLTDPAKIFEGIVIVFLIYFLKLMILRVSKNQIRYVLI
jgi:hypothetical protein